LENETCNDLINIAEKIKPIENDNEKRVFAVPESVAGIASYLISLRQHTGLHALIDFGAGTTDLSICNLLRNAHEV